MRDKFKKLRNSITKSGQSRSLFIKYFTVIISLIFVCFSILGGAMLVFVSNYWQNEKADVLKQNAFDVAKMTSDVLSLNRTTTDVESSILMICNNLRTISSAVDADVFIVDSSGKVILCQHLLSEDYKVSSNGLCSIHNKYTFSKDVLASINNGDFFETGTLNGAFSTNHLIAAEPITVKGAPAYYCFCVEEIDSGVNAFVLDILKMFLFSAIFAFMLGFFVVYGLSYSLTKPLRQMAYATKKYAIGDFSPRIKVTGRDELADLCNEFNSMATSLSILESSRRSFVANVSHELKTPMTTIGGFIDGILDGTIEDDKKDHYLEIVSNEVKRLSRLVTAMLNMSKIEAGEIQVHREKFDISSLIFSTLLSFEQIIENKQIEILGLDKLSSITISADEDMLHQVIFNLFDNAVKFTPNGGCISVQLNLSGENITVSIKNSGSGISSEEIGRIFERFYKVDKSRSYDIKGAGLGLYIVKTIIDMHGGQIYAQSIEGKYTEFIFTIPTGGF